MCAFVKYKFKEDVLIGCSIFFFNKWRSKPKLMTENFRDGVIIKQGLIF